MSFNGILLIDKPLLYTSHDIVEIVRRKLGLQRVGHTGTLDPMATGLLVILVGEGTRSFDRHVMDDKEYEGVMTLGMVTDTQDLEGRIERFQEPPDFGVGDILKVFREFCGVIEQRIPRYSSAKINGIASHRLARRNVPFEQALKRVEVKRLELSGFENPDIFFSIAVSKGTYVRTLCEDIGNALGVGAVLSGLRRIRSGPFLIHASVSLEGFKNLSLRAVQALLERFWGHNA